MKKYSSILKMSLGAALLACSLPVSAQSTIGKDVAPALLIPHNQSVGYNERTLILSVRSNLDYTITSDADWATARKGSDGAIYVHVAKNRVPAARTATLTFSAMDGKLEREMVIKQEADGSAASIVTANYFRPISATANTQQNDGPISNSYDGNTNTIYHSAYSGGNPIHVPTESNPVVLTYNFRSVDEMDFITYTPRTGNTNGNFGKVSIFAVCEGNDGKTPVATIDFGFASTPRRVEFEQPLVNPTQIKFEVYSGANNFVSCAEMEFGKNVAMPGMNVFKDELMTELVDGFTADALDTLSNPFIQNLASILYEGNYDKNYRVASYECHLSPQALSEQLAAPGKYYDQLSGVTGINIPAHSQQVVAVSGIPQNVSVALKVVAWYTGKIGGNFDGSNPNTMSYALQNGLNVIDYDYDYDGLAYVCYYDDETPENNPDIKVHFINGQVNGYLSPDKTNEEMHELLAKAPSQFMDLVGSKVHSVWTSRGITYNDEEYSKGLYDYCKASDGTSLGYIQYMNLLDSLVAWEHKLLGLEKYNRVPDNRTMAYVNFTYYMFQGGMGVSFHVDQERRVLNCKTLMYNDDDAIWGLSHEWGHQHQMSPYFCWGGQGEVTNNMHSCYNTLHMGYQPSRIRNAWTNVYAHFFENRRDVTTSTGRQNAYDNISAFSWCPALQEEMRAQWAEMENNIPSYEDDPDHGLSIYEVGVEEQLAPFYMLYNYFSTPTNEGYVVDFQEDLYESLRQNDYENGSAIEPDWSAGVKSAKTTVDKYELLARAQNNNKNGAYAEFMEKFPESVWATEGYITAGSTTLTNTIPFALNYIRKASKLCGYNLYDFFDRYGYLRTIFLQIGDYSTYYYAMTKEMKDEFKADMEAMGLKTISADMMERIAHSDLPQFETPDIPNTPTKTAE